MNEREAFEFQWPYLASFIGSTEQIEASAVRTGALTRRREVKSADALLRLAMTLWLLWLFLASDGRLRSVAGLCVDLGCRIA